jgi:hypothetical protein
MSTHYKENRKTSIWEIQVEINTYEITRN